MLLSKGNVLKNKYEDMEIEDYTMELIGKDRLKEVIELQQDVYDNLPNKDVLYMDSYSEMLEGMESGAKVIGVVTEKNQIIAYRYISFPGKAIHNLGYDIDLSEEDLDKVVHLETTVVDPKYRGNDLQSLTLLATSEMVEKDGFEHLLCTVSPYNFYSLYNTMKNGLIIKALKKKYGSNPNGDDGLWRFILHKDITKEPLLNPIDIVISKWANLDMQIELINQGYVGYKLSKDDRSLTYMKFK